MNDQATSPPAHAPDRQSGSSISTPTNPEPLPIATVPNTSTPQDSALLDPDETTVGFLPPFDSDTVDGSPIPTRPPEPSTSSPSPPENSLAPTQPPDPRGDDTSDLHISFRHSWWSLRRSKIRSSLYRQQTSTATIVRFERCGESAWVLRDTSDPSRHRLVTNRCRHRWCEACTRDRRRIVTANLRTAMEGHTLRLLTLTLKASPAPLPDQLDRLYDSFKNFRRHRLVAERMTGGVYFLELTYNERTERWHPHLHIIFEGGYLPHVVAKDLWHTITGDSFIVDVRPLNGAEGAAGYVAKYATKAVGASVWTHTDRLDEAMDALAGRRCFQPFGDWTALHLSKPPGDDTEWIPVCTLATVIRRHKAGDPDASCILRQLAAGFAIDFQENPPVEGDTS